MTCSIPQLGYSNLHNSVLQFAYKRIQHVAKPDQKADLAIFCQILGKNTTKNTIKKLSLKNQFSQSMHHIIWKTGRQLIFFRKNWATTKLKIRLISVQLFFVSANFFSTK